MTSIFDKWECPKCGKSIEVRKAIAVFHTCKDSQFNKKVVNFVKREVK